MQWLVNSWYQRRWFRFLLWPISVLYGVIVACRRTLFRLGIFKSESMNVPVIVVGNLTVGGTGKTPLVAAIAHDLINIGRRPGIVSRGYKGHAKTWPQFVTADSDPLQVGDESVVLAQQCRCPVAAAPKRVHAARYLIDQKQCDVIISDDGLQHYGLQRDIEIVVIDGERRLGNWMLLPAGPLRELVSRLAKVDMIVVNGEACNDEYAMTLQSMGVVNFFDATQTLSPQRIHAVAAIGNPQRFFQSLRWLGYEVIEHAFPDHYFFKSDDLRFAEKCPIVMTSKDAIKCQSFAHSECWIANVSAQLDEAFFQQMHSCLHCVSKVILL